MGQGDVYITTFKAVLVNAKKAYSLNIYKTNKKYFFDIYIVILLCVQFSLKSIYCVRSEKMKEAVWNK